MTASQTKFVFFLQMKNNSLDGGRLISQIQLPLFAGAEFPHFFLSGCARRQPSLPTNVSTQIPLVAQTPDGSSDRGVPIRAVALYSAYASYLKRLGTSPFRLTSFDSVNACGMSRINGKLGRPFAEM